MKRRKKLEGDPTKVNVSTKSKEIYTEMQALIIRNERLEKDNSANTKLLEEYSEQIEDKDNTIRYMEEQKKEKGCVIVCLSCGHTYHSKTLGNISSSDLSETNVTCDQCGNILFVI